MTPTKLTAEEIAHKKLTTEQIAVIYQFHQKNKTLDVRLGHDIVDALFDHIAAVAQERDQAREALRAVEFPIRTPTYGCFQDGSVHWRCAACHKHEIDGHAPDCIVGKALRGAK